MSATTSSSKVSPPTGGLRAPKPKTSKVVTIKLPSSRLLAFPHEQATRKPSIKVPSSASTPSAAKESPTATESNSDAKPTVKGEETNTLQIPTENGRKKGGPSGPRGTKRSLCALTDGTSKPRAKPGPKKRPRLDGTFGPDEPARPWTTPAPAAGHKLGPKANQGAINAGLRALDRKGKPCRKWEKKSFSVKSFTGVMWQIPSWRAPKKVIIDVKAEAGQSDTPTSTSETQVVKGSSNVGSDNSQNAATEGNPAMSSPQLSVATPA